MVETAQAIDGYGCTCGLVDPDLNVLRGHWLRANRGTEKGKHRSIGRINLSTGEKSIPPVALRNKEQKQQTQYGVTSSNREATELRIVPRFTNIDYSPVMRMGQEAATRLWGWPSTLPLGDFIDTIIYRYFKRCGITLAGILIDETEEERKVRISAVIASQGGETHVVKDVAKDVATKDAVSV